MELQDDLDDLIASNWVMLKQALEDKGFKAEMGEVTMKPQNETELAGEDAMRMQKLLDALEDLDDVQDVYTSATLLD